MRDNQYSVTLWKSKFVLGLKSFRYENGQFEYVKLMKMYWISPSSLWNSIPFIMLINSTCQRGMTRFLHKKKILSKTEARYCRFYHEFFLHINSRNKIFDKNVFRDCSSLFFCPYCLGLKISQYFEWIIVKRNNELHAMNLIHCFS